MEKEIVFGGYRLLVDVEKTRAYYDAHPLPWVTCTCAGCRNFVEAAKQLSEEVKTFFDTLGADLEKPAETSWNPGSPTEANGDAWYHVCGRIADRIEPPENQAFGELLNITETFSAAFRPECWLLPDDFPRPCFQMEVFFLLPWVLEEPNPDII